MAGDPWVRFLNVGYRFRWLLAGVTIALIVGATMAGMSRVASFSSKIESLKASPSARPVPRMFDTRTETWFDQRDAGLQAYREVEDRFIAEDVVVIAFEDAGDPWGAFGKEALTTVARLTNEIERVPYVRAVRSLTRSPWIRWGEAAPGEPGLQVSDLFERSLEHYSDDERLERMIAVLGADGASRLAGVERVRQILGPDARFEDHLPDSRFIDGIVSADGRTAALQVQILRQKLPKAELDRVFGDDSAARAIGPELHSIEAQSEALNAINAVLARETRYPMHIAGTPVLQKHFPEVGMRDMAFLGLMFLAIMLVLFAIFRHVGGVLLPIVVVILGIFGMNGLVWAYGDLLNNMTAVAPVVLTTVGIGESVHLVATYFQYRGQFDDRRALIVEVLRKNSLAILLTAVTTAAAFFSFVTSEVIPIKMFGYTCGIGTVIAYLVTMTVVPALLSLIPLPRREATSAIPQPGGGVLLESSWTDRLLDAVLRRKTAVLLGAALVAGLSVLGMTRIRIESDIRLVFPEDDPVTRDTRWIEQRLGGSGDLDLVFYGPELRDAPVDVAARQKQIEQLELAKRMDPGLNPEQSAELATLQRARDDHDRRLIATNAEFLRQVDAFERRIRQEAQDPAAPLHAITNLDSGLSVLRRIHQVQNGNAAAFYRVPTENDVAEGAREPTVIEDEVAGETLLVPGQTASSMASQYYLQYENGVKPAYDLSGLVTNDRRGFRIAARVKSESTSTLRQAYDRIRTIARDEFPALTGSPEMLESGQALSSLRTTGKHYLFINMIDRFSETLILSLLTTIPMMTLIISIVFRSLSLGLVSMVPNILPLLIPFGLLGLLGIPLDGPAVIVATVALGVVVDDTIHLLGKYSEARRKGLDGEDAARQAFRDVGPAVSWTSLILIVGFGVLSLSSFRPNMMMGVMGALMVLLGWIADMVVTPVLLTLMARKTPAPRGEWVPDVSPS